MKNSLSNIMNVELKSRVKKISDILRVWHHIHFTFYFRSMGIADKPFHVVLLHDPQGFLKIPNAFVPVMELLYGMKEISLWLDLVDKRNYELIKLNAH